MLRPQRTHQIHVPASATCLARSPRVKFVLLLCLSRCPGTSDGVAKETMFAERRERPRLGTEDSGLPQLARKLTLSTLLLGHTEDDEPLRTERIERPKNSVEGCGR